MLDFERMYMLEHAKLSDLATKFETLLDRLGAHVDSAVPAQTKAELEEIQAILDRASGQG